MPQWFFVLCMQDCNLINALSGWIWTDLFHCAYCLLKINRIKLRMDQIDQWK